MKKKWFMASLVLLYIGENIDGSPVDNRPSTNQLHHLKKERKKGEKKYMGHVTHDTRHLTPDM